MKNSRGFTLIEAMVVVAILGIVSAIAYPSFRSSMENAELRKAAAAIDNALDRTRIAAIESNKRVVLCPVDQRSDRACGTDWSLGVLVFEDDDQNNDYSAQEKMVGFFDINDKAVEVNTNVNMKYVGFLGGGSKAKFSGGIPGTIEITPLRSGSKSKICLKLNRLGQVARKDDCDNIR